jgi:hypothetical protein
MKDSCQCDSCLLLRQIDEAIRYLRKHRPDWSIEIYNSNIKGDDRPLCLRIWDNHREKTLPKTADPREPIMEFLMSEDLPSLLRQWLDNDNYEFRRDKEGKKS